MNIAADLEENVVEVTDLEFAYGGQAPFISKFLLKLKRGARCLLIGANGAGKTTLLRILAGKHMVGGKNVVCVLGRSAFHDTALTCSGAVKDIARVATGVGIVAAECAKGVRLGALAFQGCSRRDACVGGAFGSSEAERRGVAMDGDVGESRKAEQAVPPQPEDLFVPKKAAASTEATPFKSAEADADVEPLSQQIGLPSVDAHLPP